MDFIVTFGRPQDGQAARPPAVEIQGKQNGLETLQTIRLAYPHVRPQEIEPKTDTFTVNEVPVILNEGQARRAGAAFAQESATHVEIPPPLNHYCYPVIAKMVAADENEWDTYDILTSMTPKGGRVMTLERFTDYLEKTLQLSEDIHKREYAYYQPDASVWHSTRVEGLTEPKKMCCLCLAWMRIAQTALAKEKAIGNLKPVRFEKEQEKLMALDFFREGDVLMALSCFYEPHYPASVIQRADKRYTAGAKPTEMKWAFKSFHGWTQYLAFVADVRAHMDEIKVAEDEFRTCLTMETTDEPVKTLDA